MNRLTGALIALAVALGFLVFFHPTSGPWHRPPSVEECLTNHPSWSRDTCKMISKKQVQLGMTKGQVRASRGEPQDINKTTTQYGSSEQWVYEIPDTHYLYFDDGVLTGIQD